MSANNEANREPVLDQISMRQSWRQDNNKQDSWKQNKKYSSNDQSSQNSVPREKRQVSMRQSWRQDKYDTQSSKYGAKDHKQSSWKQDLAQSSSSSSNDHLYFDPDKNADKLNKFDNQIHSRQEWNAHARKQAEERFKDQLHDKDREKHRVDAHKQSRDFLKNYLKEKKHDQSLDLNFKMKNSGDYLPDRLGRRERSIPQDTMDNVNLGSALDQISHNRNIDQGSNEHPNWLLWNGSNDKGQDDGA